MYLDNVLIRDEWRLWREVISMALSWIDSVNEAMSSFLCALWLLCAV